MTTSLLMYVLWASTAFYAFFFLKKALKTEHPLSTRRI